MQWRGRGADGIMRRLAAAYSVDLRPHGYLRSQHFLKLSGPCCVTSQDCVARRRSGVPSPSEVVMTAAGADPEVILRGGGRRRGVGMDFSEAHRPSG